MEQWTQLAVAALAIERMAQIVMAVVRQKKQNGNSGERPTEYWENRLLTQEAHRRYVDDVVKPMGQRMERLEDGIKELLRRRAR